MRLIGKIILVRLTLSDLLNNDSDIYNMQCKDKKSKSIKQRIYPIKCQFDFRKFINLGDDVRDTIRK